MLLALPCLLLLTGCVGGAAAEAGNGDAASSSAAPTQPAPVPTSVPTPSPSPTSEPTPDATQFAIVDPASYDLAASPLLAGTEAGDPGRGFEFDSPSGNLHCGIYRQRSSEDFLYGCRIDEKDWSFPDADPSDFCHGMEVRCGWGIESDGGETPRPLAKSDATYSLHPVDWVLPYGSAIVVGPITCESTDTGVTCRDADHAHGFTISHSRNRIW